MKMRKLGAGGPMVSAIGLGCMGMAGWYGERNDEEAAATIHHALDCGITFLDTADVYGQGENEQFIGATIKGRSDEVFLATKCGNSWAREGWQAGLNARPDYVSAACEQSLKRLGTDVIDLYQLHRVDPKTPIEDTMGAMARLVEAGKVRFVGLSEAGPATIRRAHQVHPLAALQSELSLWTRDHETGSLLTCQELGIAFVAYSPLGRGMLTGQLKSVTSLPAEDRRLNHPRFLEGNFEKNRDVVHRLSDLAAGKGCLPAQLTLAWVLNKGENVIPIPGTQRRTYLDQNIAAIDIELSADEIAELEAAFPPGVAAGERYSEAMMRAIES